MTDYVIVPPGGSTVPAGTIASGPGGFSFANGDTVTVLPNAYQFVSSGSVFIIPDSAFGVGGLTNSGWLSSGSGTAAVIFNHNLPFTDVFPIKLVNTSTGSITGGQSGIVVHNSSGIANRQTSIVNQGTISSTGPVGGSFAGIEINGGITDIHNTGTISALSSGMSINSKASAGLMSLWNSGNLIGDVVSASGLVFDNTGGHVLGNVVCSGAAADTINNAGGTITGLVDLGAGDDTLTGGDGVEKVVGGDGNDDIDLGGGNDTYYGTNTSLIGGASDGNDMVDGGAGIDTYVIFVMGAPNSNTINLTDGIVTGVEFGTDHILNFENVVGSGVSDVITGSAVRNVLSGDAGSDSISGLAGNDRIYGGQGADTITGGAGQDVMTGGSGPATGDGARDTFVFSALSDSGAAGAPRDWITDFTQGSAATADRINLAAIDANTTLTGNQAFIWQAAAGAAFTGVKGQLHYAILGGNTYISGDVNGDKIADFSIGLTGSHALAAVDFFL